LDKESRYALRLAFQEPMIPLLDVLVGDPLCVGLVSTWQNAKGVAVQSAPDRHALIRPN
jgi:hypothetical protein